MEKLLKWGKTDTVTKNNNLNEKIQKVVDTKSPIVSLPTIYCAKEIKVDNVDSFLTSQGFTKANGVTNALGGSNLRYKNKFFIKKLSNGDYIELRVMNSRSKDPISFNILKILIACCNGQNYSKAAAKIYKGLEQ